MLTAAVLTVVVPDVQGADPSQPGLAPSLSGPSGDRVAMVRTELAPATDGVIEDVRIESEGDTTPVTLLGPEGVLFTAFQQQDPERAVVDLPSVGLESLADPVAVYDGLVDEVSMTSHLTGSGEVMTRVEITLNQPVDYSVTATDEGLQIRLESLSAMEMADSGVDSLGEMDDASDPWAITPIGDDGMTAGAVPLADAKPATWLMAVDVAQTDEGSLVHLRADGMISNVATFTLENPDRLVIDLADMKSAVENGRVEVGSDHIARVRVGQHAEMVRIVLDAGSAFDPFDGRRVMPMADGLLVALGTGEALEMAVADAATVAPEETATNEMAEEVAEDLEIDAFERAGVETETAAEEEDPWLSTAEVEETETESEAASAAPNPTAEMPAAETFGGGSPVTIYGVEFDTHDELDRIVILGEHPFDYIIFEPNPETVVLSIQNAVIDPEVAMRITPEPGGPISLVTAFEQPDMENPEVRVVVTRAAGLQPEVTRRGALLVMDFPRSGAVTLSPPVITTAPTQPVLATETQVATADAPTTTAPTQVVSSSAPALLAPSLSGPSGDRVAMVRTELAPAIDGVLDDVAWAEAALLGPLTQVEPVVGAPTQRTEVRLLYDDDHLYVGIRCFDTEPDKIVAQVMLRDADLDPDDRVQMVFDTFHDRRNAFFFEVNPNGARGDGLVENSRKPNKDWDGIWYAKARIDEQGWTAEFALPFKTVSFDRGGKNWGFNLERVIRRNNEVLRWQAASQDRRLHDIGDAGVLTGLSGMSQGLGLDVSPSITVRPWDDRLGDNLIVEPSLDLRYRFTPSLAGTLTFNTDFAETEVDEREVNLTRFDLFFPEKREFFLQDAGIFEFGGIKKNGRPFFSRRIGIDEEGEPVRIWFGGKVSGRIGPWNIGFLDTQINSDGELDSSNLLVTRVSRNVLEESGVGMIFTYGDPLTNDDNWLVGADFNYRTTDFLDEQILTANLWFQKSSTEGVNSRENAFGVQVDYPNDVVEAALGFFEIQENFNPALGFVNRRGIRQYEGEFRYRFRPHGMIRTVDTGFEAELFTDDKDNRVETGALDIIVVRLENDAEDSVELHSVLEHEVLEEEFDIVDDVLIPPDTYTWWKGGVVIETATSRPLSGGLEFFWGEFYRGHRTEIKPSLAWAPSKHFLLVLEYETNFVRLEEGNFTTYLARGRFNIQFTPDLSWNTLMQWDNETNLFGINTRFRWIVEEGNEISLVFNHNAFVDSVQYRATFNEVLTKVKWTFRF